jgi:hypothetical protein
LIQKCSTSLHFVVYFAKNLVFTLKMFDFMVERPTAFEAEVKRRIGQKDWPGVAGGLQRRSKDQPFGPIKKPTFKGLKSLG